VARFRACLLAIVAVAALLAAGSGVGAAGGLTVSDKGVVNRFPDGLEFRVSAQGGQAIEEVRLRYTVLPDGSAASGVPDFSADTSISAEFTLAGSDTPQVYLPPGTRIDYHWEVKDASGNVATTDEASVVYEDVRFDWKTAEANGVSVYYYSGGDDDAQAMLAVAEESLADTAALLGATVEFPVQVRVYGSREDMQPALQRRSETYESQIITAGVRVSSDTVLVLGNVSFDTLRHELAHVVTAIAGEGPFGRLPAWLDEGTAVYAQTDAGGFRGSVERAIERGNVLSVRSLTSYQGDPAKVDLFYGQSWSLVSFLVETYGEEKFAQLFAEIKEGNTTDSALEAVYGFDQDGLENEWRAGVGLPPREGPDGDDEEPVPTFPASSGDDGPSESGDGDGDGLSAGVIVVLALGVVAVAGAVAFATWVLARRLR
jgi:hypothetical protein